MYFYIIDNVDYIIDKVFIYRNSFWKIISLLVYV